MSKRADHGAIAAFVTPGASVLDVGCGDGALLAFLRETRGCDGRGLELSQAGVNACVAKGLSVVQGDADRDLAFYPDKGFDFAILSHTIGEVRDPFRVLHELQRVGHRVIVSFPNFGHWRARWTYFAGGRAPSTPGSAAAWHDRQASRPCTVRDFAALAKELGLKITRAAPIARGKTGPPFAEILWRANWFAEEVVCLLAPHLGGQAGAGEAEALAVGEAGQGVAMAGDGGQGAPSPPPAAAFSLVE